MKKITFLILTVVILTTLISCTNSNNIDFDEIVKDRPIIVDETQPSIYTISFQTNGGTQIEPIERETLSITPYTTREGYDFKGWYLDSALTQEAVFPMNITENIVLYAKWEVKKYTVAFISNGGTPVNRITTDILQQAPTITKDGYAFEGWYTDSTLTNKVIFPLYLSKNTTLYAKWLQKVETIAFDDVKIKDASGYSNSKKINVTSKSLNLEELAAQGYYMTITISYDVEYNKDYNVPLDIGYMGAPKHEIYLYRNNGIVIEEEDIKTPSSDTHKTITYTEKISNMKDVKFYFMVSTNNIQNIIYFKNITVTYQCTK